MVFCFVCFYQLFLYVLKVQVKVLYLKFYLCVSIKLYFKYSD